MNQKKESVPIIRSSAAEYLSFVAASEEGGVEAVYADENVLNPFHVFCGKRVTAESKI